MPFDLSGIELGAILVGGGAALIGVLSKFFKRQ